MTEDTTNLVLEQLRLLRTDIAGTNGKIDALETKMDTRLAALSGRIDTLETEVRGLNYIVTVAIGSLMHDMTDLKARVGALEKV